MDVKAEESVLGGEKGLPDIDKAMPFVFAPGSRTYHGIGKVLGNAFSIGKEIPGFKDES